ncbi:MAG: type II CRISPR RNA-guided endonuclease Cas9 [Ignavibacteria bacterium]|nr:type II CRISPR RNA-guided endonuclease Cas9 [Ignavibacteria bacterium]
MSKVLGLDIGSNSVGWALVDLSASNIVGMGVRIFPESVESPNTEKEQSKNVTRRLKRQVRRQYERRRMRKDAVRRMLFHLNLLPTDPETFRDTLKQDPYELRMRALNERMELYEIGRIVDHLASRRGFQSNRKTSSDEESSGVIYEGAKDGSKPGINDIDESLNPELRLYSSFLKNRSELIQNLPALTDGYRTVGEYLYSLDPHVRRRRCRFTLRDHFKIELDIILGRQSKYYPDLLTDSVINQIRNTVFFQRPLKSARKLVGQCRFEPGKKRCHKSHPEFQRFRFLQQMNSLRIRSQGRIEEDDMMLTPSERVALELYVKQKGALDTSKPKNVKDALGWKDKTIFQINAERVDGLSTYRSLTQALGADTIAAMNRNEIHELWNTLNYAADKDWIIDEWKPKGLTLSREQRQSLAKIKLEDGYGSLSLRAIRKILPFLEEGMQYSEAATAAGYTFTDTLISVPITDIVPRLAPEDARNPIVQRSFAETRKVVNAIIRKWGNPDVIRIELGRELRVPAFERARMQKEMYKNRDRNEADRQRLREEYNIAHGSVTDVLKLRLWEEQQYECIYTGKPISKNMLFNGSTDIDHILPYSRTLDDGRENKVLCLREANASKGDRIPMEACDEGIFNRESFKQRVDNLISKHNISVSKQRKLLMTTDVFNERFTNDDETGFVARQLNDTRFAARLALKYLRNVSPSVQAVTGQMTAMLRRKWGLDGVLTELAAAGRAWVAPSNEPGRKDRSDHRHHAIDALTVALTDRSLVKRISDMNVRTGSAKDALLDGRLALPDAPLPGVRALALRVVDNIIVSHRIGRPGRGPLHEETFYGISRDRDGNQLYNERDVPLFVVRKPLSSLTSNEITDIVDPVVKKVVFDRLAFMGVNTETEKFTVPKNAFAEPLYLPRRDGSRGHVIRRVRVYKASTGMHQLRRDGLFVETGGNDFIRIIRTPGSKKALWEVRTLLDTATNAKSKIESVGDGQELKLRIGELVRFTDGDIYKVQKVRKDNGQVGLYHHADATGDVKHLRNPYPSGITGDKLRVDHIGFLIES